MFQQQAEKFAKDRPWSSEYELIVRFKSQFCYLYALKKGEWEGTLEEGIAVCEAHIDD